MKIRVWLKKRNRGLELVPITANSRKEALQLLKQHRLNQEIDKIERWNGKYWKSYVKPI